MRIVGGKPLRAFEVGGNADGFEFDRIAITFAEALFDQPDREMGDVIAFSPIAVLMACISTWSE